MDSLKEKIIKGIIVFLLIVMMALISYRIYYKFAIEPTKEKETKEKNNKVKEASKYNNYNRAILNVCTGMDSDNDKTLDLEIVDGKLTAKLDEEEIEVKGIKGTVKSFVYGHIGCADCSVNNEIVLVINSKNELFLTDAYHYKRDDYMTFEEIKIDEDIVDITRVDMSTYFSTCEIDNIAAVLKDGTIKYFKVESEFDDESEYSKVKIDSLYGINLSEFKQTVSPYLMIYKDNTIGAFDLKGEYGEEFNERLKYNGEVLKADKVYYNAGYDVEKTYVVYNNMLYMVEHKIDYENYKVNMLGVTLISESKIKKESIDTSKKELYKYEKDVDIDITFEDGNTYKIEAINRIYNNVK